MNEEPSEFPDYQKPGPPNFEPPDFWIMFFLGIGLFVASGFACFGTQNMVPVLLAALTAFLSVFFRGWRGIFAGYFTAIGLVVLAFIVICGMHPLRM